MDEFSYAHRNTSGVNKWNKPDIPPELQRIRDGAFAREIPVARDDSLSFLIALAAAVRPRRILELGTAVGTTAAALAFICPYAHITTVERDKNFYDEAVRNFDSLGISPRIFALLGDAGGVISALEGQFDFIFMDCAKVQYIKLLPRLKEDGLPIDALIVDPPRTGLAKSLIKTLLRVKPASFVYISCNPSTLAQDLVLLGEAYDVRVIENVDMLPQTPRWWKLPPLWAGNM